MDFVDTNDDLDQTESIDRQKRVHKLLSGLGEKCQEILKMFYWQKMSMDDIASALSMESKSVKNGKYRCIQQLKKSADASQIVNLL